MVSGTDRYETALFQLQLGLYPIGRAFGWRHGSTVAGPASMTILVRAPGDADLRPATTSGFVRQTKPRSD
jgi:hypothetical protein